MARIDRTSAAPGETGAEGAAPVAPKEAPVEASGRFSDLMSKPRDRQRDDGDAEQPAQRQESRPKDRQFGDPRGEGAPRPQGADPRESPVTASASRIAGQPPRETSRADAATGPAKGDDPTVRPGQGPALRRTEAPPSPAKSAPLPGPAEGLFRRAPAAPGEVSAAAQASATHGPASHGPASHGPASQGPASHGPASHDSLGRGATRARPGDDPAGDAERLSAGGALPSTGPAALQRGEPPLGVSAAAPAGDTADVDIIAELADRILVAEPKGGQNEVRIRLNMDTLQGTEITLKHDANGLSVCFETPSPEIAERLAAARQGLTERLQEKTGNDVTVEIAHAEDEAAKDRGDGRGDGRSRNRIDYEPDSGDNA